MIMVFEDAVFFNVIFSFGTWTIPYLGCVFVFVTGIMLVGQ